MTKEEDRLMRWRPGDPGFSRDEVILAVGLQCRQKQFPVGKVLEWLGFPYKTLGNAAGGHLAYLYTDDTAEIFPMFYVVDAKVVNFGAVSRFTNNSKRADSKTGEEVLFNILDEMEPFDESKFK